MKIGMDIDDTICNTHAVLIKYAQKYSKENFGRNIVKYNSNNFSEVLGCNYDEMGKFYRKYYTTALKEIIPFYGTKEILTKLKEEGHQVHFITVRNDRECDGSAYDITRKWLIKYQIPYDSLNVNINDKKTFCKDNNIDIFIDDSVSTCEKVFELGIRVYLSNAAFNIEYNNDKIIRVENMPDFLNKIQDIKI